MKVVLLASSNQDAKRHFPSPVFSNPLFLTVPIKQFNGFVILLSVNSLSPTARNSTKSISKSLKIISITHVIILNNLNYILNIFLHEVGADQRICPHLAFVTLRAETPFRPYN